jgi:hypothetical protein
MSELRDNFSKSDEPSFLIFAVASWLRKYPYEFLAAGLFMTLLNSWVSQLRPLFHFDEAPEWRSWTVSFVGAAQSELLLLTSLMLLVSSGKLRNGLAKGLRALLGATAGIFFLSSLLIYRWADISHFSYPQVGIGLLFGLVNAALHLLMFWWATDPRTLRPYDGAETVRPTQT